MHQSPWCIHPSKMYIVRVCVCVGLRNSSRQGSSCEFYKEFFLLGWSVNPLTHYLSLFVSDQTKQPIRDHGQSSKVSCWAIASIQRGLSFHSPVLTEQHFSTLSAQSWRYCICSKYGSVHLYDLHRHASYVDELGVQLIAVSSAEWAAGFGSGQGISVLSWGRQNLWHHPLMVVKIL